MILRDGIGRMSIDEGVFVSEQVQRKTSVGYVLLIQSAVVTAVADRYRLSTDFSATA